MRLAAPVIINETKLNGRQLRSFCCKGLRYRSIKAAGIVIYVRYRKPGWDIQGYCDGPGEPLYLYVEEGGTTPHLLRLYAEVLDHELDHYQGLDHEEMVPDEERVLPWVLGTKLENRK